MEHCTMSLTTPTRMFAVIESKTGIQSALGAFLAVAFLSAAQARAQLTVEITEGVSDPIPIAIVPFGPANVAPTFDVAQVVANDLKRSGLFEPMPRKDMVDKPTRSEDVKLDDWRL